MTAKRKKTTDMAVAVTALNSNGEVIKGFNNCEHMVVLRTEIHAIVEREREKVDVPKGGSEPKADLQGFVARMGFASLDSYYKFLYSTKSNWINIDLADRILVGLGLQYLFNTGEITIYQIREGLAHPLV